MVVEGQARQSGTSAGQDREAFIREALEYTQKVYAQSQGSAMTKSIITPRKEINDPGFSLQKPSEGQVSKSATSPEQGREASIREAVEYAQQVYESITVKSEPALRTKKYEGPKTSLTVSTEGQSSRTVSTFRRHPLPNAVYAMCSHCRQTLKQLEDMSFERSRVVHAMVVAHFNIELAVNYLVNGIPENTVIEQLLPPATPTSRNPTSQPTIKVCGHAPSIPSGVPAEATKAIQKSVNGILVTPQHSLAHRNLETNSNASVLGPSSTKLLGDKYTKNWNKKTPDHTTATAAQIPASKWTGPTGIKKHGDKSLASAKYLTVKGTIEKSPSRSTPSDSQLELEMQKMIPVNSSNPDVPLSDADFDRIAKLLNQAGRDEWSFRPRTYALLRMIDAIDLLDDFVKKDCLDIALPYNRANLPRSLSPEQRDRFLKKQRFVMTAAAILEGGLKSKHANFLDNADNHLEALNKLGKGGSAVVDRVKSKLSHKFYVRKRLKRDETFEKSAEALRFFKREVGHLKKLSHHHLVRYVGSYTDPQYVGIIMEPVADMDFKTFLSQSSFTTREHECIREAFGCLCAAIIYLHLQKVRHKDIKPENILVKQWKVFITDFGIARDWKALGRSTTTGDHGPISVPYAPPEVMEHEPRNSSADVWSLGCVYLDMITVLNGETLASKLGYFMSNGNSSIVHSKNPDAFNGWMKKLESKKEIAPLDWIKNITQKTPAARLNPQQLMDRILTCNDGDYYGLCCDGKNEEDVAVELRNSDVDDFSDSEDQSEGGRTAKKVLDMTVLENQLVEAVKTQDVNKLKKWLRRATHLRNRCLKTSAIHRAAANGNAEIVGILIQFGCDLECKLDGSTPLSAAIRFSRESTTKLLASTNIGINTLEETRGSLSALHIAARNSFRAGIRILLEAGAKVDLRNQRQETPLFMAVGNGDLPSVKILLEHGANTELWDCFGLSVLKIAAARGFEKIVQILLDYKAKIDSYNATSRNFLTPLLNTISCENPAVVRLLLLRGANVNLQPRVNGQLLPSPLHHAVMTNQLEVVEILIEFKVNLESRDTRNRTPLFVACQLPETQIALRLIAAGADVQSKVDPFRSILTTVVQASNFPAAQFLIDNKARLDLRNRVGRTLLHEAVFEDCEEIIDFLLKNHIDVDAKDSNGQTALMSAAEYDRAASVRKLKEHGASIDTQDRAGNTALHIAAACGSAEAASLLLEYGSDPIISSKTGFRAIGIAHEYGHKEISDLIFKALERAGRVSHDSGWPEIT